MSIYAIIHKRIKYELCQEYYIHYVKSYCNMELESQLAFSSVDIKLLHEWYVCIVYICINVYMHVGSYTWAYVCMWGH